MNVPRRRISAPEGFTIVELLVVISIISLLITMLLPALSSARESAYIIKCAANNRQLGIATMGYSMDTEGWVAPAAIPEVYNQYDASYRLDAYLEPGTVPTGNKRINVYSAAWDCPSHMSPIADAPNGRSSRTTSFRFNSAMNRRHLETTPRWNPKMDEVYKPQQKVVLCETLTTWSSPYNNYFYSQPTTQGFFHPNGGHNILFVDLHVATLNQTDPVFVISANLANHWIPN